MYKIVIYQKKVFPLLCILGLWISSCSGPSSSLSADDSSKQEMPSLDVQRAELQKEKESLRQKKKKLRKVLRRIADQSKKLRIPSWAYFLPKGCGVGKAVWCNRGSKGEANERSKGFAI